jgi:RNA polymerase sigma-70 factor (ECF subfamily)
MPDEEAELLRLLQEAFGPGLRRFVMRLTADGMFADDVVQETLIRAWQHPAVLQRPEPAVRAWLFTVARHLVIDDRRSARGTHPRPSDIRRLCAGASAQTLCERPLTGDGPTR